MVRAAADSRGSSSMAANTAANSEADVVDSRENVCRVRSLLMEELRVELRDGRVIAGRLECFDKLGNMILSDAYEVNSGNRRNRCHKLGLVLAPGNAQISVRVRKSALEKNESADADDDANATEKAMQGLSVDEGVRKVLNKIEIL